MNLPTDQLSQSILQKETLEQCSVAELQQLAATYPYFGLVQLLLAKKLQANNDGEYASQVQKASLYFHDPLWLEYLMNVKGNATVLENTTIPFEATSTVEHEVEEKEETIAAEEINPAYHTHEGEDSTHLAIAEKVTDYVNPSDVEIDHTPTESNLELANELVPAEVSNEEQDNVISVVADVAIKDDVAMHDSPHTVEPELVTKENEDTEELDTIEEDDSSTAPMMNIPSLKIEAIDPSKAELTFEPFHTVDYFASQGIKFREDDKPGDKFGKQLKSFTDWLKTIRKVPVTEISVKQETITEAKVEQLAQHSVEEREVLTEAMAEVWEKQGNMDKAVGIYYKLSLLDPSKSAYFAAKIEGLKKTN